MRRAVLSIRVGSLGSGPHEGCQNWVVETRRRMEEEARLMRIWSWWWEEERQLGNSGETGRPWLRMTRRSGGNVMLNLDSRSENSASERPSEITTLQDLRRSMRDFAYAANEKHIRLGRGGFELPLCPSAAPSLVTIILIMDGN